MSPTNILTTTITYELRMGTNFKVKVIGLILKYWGVILPVGHFANWVFWYNKMDSFISSYFYGKKLLVIV
jgi:phage pi2 protein 07